MIGHVIGDDDAGEHGAELAVVAAAHAGADIAVVATLRVATTDGRVGVEAGEGAAGTRREAGAGRHECDGIGIAARVQGRLDLAEIEVLRERGGGDELRREAGIGARRMRWDPLVGGSGVGCGGLPMG